MNLAVVFWRTVIGMITVETGTIDVSDENTPWAAHSPMITG